MDLEPGRAEVSNNGEIISFPEHAKGLQRIASETVTRGSAVIPVVAPARVVAAVSRSHGGVDRMVLFDSPEVTSLYSRYKQSVVNTERASRNLDRIREMYELQSATGRDMNEAESEAATARAMMAEHISKLSALGHDVNALASVSVGTIWLIADVPESQLHEVQQGERVKVVFAAFPDRIMTGRAEAVGEVIDPVTRTVKVRVFMSNPNGVLLPGMFARVDFGDPVSDVIVLPASAVVTVEGQDYTFVELAPREFHRRRVTLANSGERKVAVLTGLEDGQKVVTSGAILLKGLSFGY